METKALQFDTGVVNYDINGVINISFNPTDTTFVEGLFKTFDDLDKKQEAYKAEIEAADKREIFNIARRRDAEMRQMIDAALGAPVCDALFGGMNVYALASGLPVWANLLLTIMDEIDTVFAREQKMTDGRIRKYSEKYKNR